ncbi:MAG: hypothetical protein R3C12_24890 [Planctomycetaceae bacterium]
MDSYRRAIHYGIRKANRLLLAEGKPEIPRWFPLQLRHSRATELNENFGIEAAAVTLGRRVRRNDSGVCGEKPEIGLGGGPPTG